MNRITWIVVISATLFGCASNPRIENLTGEQRARAASIEVYQKAPKRDYDVIKTVSGLSCNRDKYQDQNVTDHEALEGIKIQAALAGADAVIYTFCQTNSDTDWVNNCWASVKCIGDAVKFK
ncbi:hypothetical protein D8T65_24480 [Vibrio vulnificus]|uniref:hypothetical protein n=1 Tax=Vibrio vulnificus TaxID=672 RepID=UPI00102907EB|nr:hypothetical protein [Vibrio vulnificus]EIT7127039.1 hypothetical protein [Vibrio parahaemolyticus]EIT7132051.1 hypothetical protein [Vibrio parahaemolyticus]EIZ4252523.1 hypothetical protein [Vibrio parahaemolyticus]MCA3903837.1 hypothetical protein [Vibrio vulnificus]RZP95448.1 hypothetical protein D8T65_24480 [Vibrio vulnificus]